ncbi:carboxymethylenebutenolidase [Streptomyces humidus]|uniref:Carboxymethylenebutenolidase n=1 Tax=Streptomyces humidus TaxID=52259 RepID=A0A918G767_9ACTN|nr:dienelactone hydrolase family protein [Streptomyces humidus]GGS20545.1 carboxymethylenebutenolidase [Streptomyces humidus]
MDIAFPRIEPAVAPVPFTYGSRRTLPVARIELGGVPRGAAIVLCAAGALERDAGEVMNGLAEKGYESVAVDLSPGTGAVSDRDLLGDVSVLMGLLGERGWSSEQVGLVGYGFGGRTALLAAAEFEVGAAVSVGAPLIRATRPVKTPWLGLFGRQDPAAPPEAVACLRARLRDSPVHTEVVTYPGVARDFRFDAREAQAHAASFDVWQRTVEWLELRVAPRLTAVAQKWQTHTASGAAGPSRV